MNTKTTDAKLPIEMRAGSPRRCRILGAFLQAVHLEKGLCITGCVNEACVYCQGNFRSHTDEQASGDVPLREHGDFESLMDHQTKIFLPCQYLLGRSEPVNVHLTSIRHGVTILRWNEE
jgi:hypothetical protein